MSPAPVDLSVVIPMFDEEAVLPLLVERLRPVADAWGVTYEILCVDDVPDAVAVSEAVALVQDLSTDESPSFVNGVLGAVLRSRV